MKLLPAGYPIVKVNLQSFSQMNKVLYFYWCKLKTFVHIIISCVLCLTISRLYSQEKSNTLAFDFYGDSIVLQAPLSSALKGNKSSTFSEEQVKNYFDEVASADYDTLIKSLLFYRDQYKLDDWLYYQLIRKTVQQISPKLENYERYTVFKWFLLVKSGYGATLKISRDKLLFYVQTNEQIFELPYYTKSGKQYVCLNYHDYEPVDFIVEKFKELNMLQIDETRAFTYKVHQLPNFKQAEYVEKDIQFNYYDVDYHFKVKLNPQVKTIFKNYPVVDYESYFNIPLSNETYQSLIPLLRNSVKNMKVKAGVDFLMRFTRYAFLFETDTKAFGKEKRLSPEQTLLYDKSDCEDRAALFFFIVKEIYNLPMIVLSFPKHITIAVKFDKPIGQPVYYNGEIYSVCEPTPQGQIDLSIGHFLPTLRNTPYEVVYSYKPLK